MSIGFDNGSNLSTTWGAGTTTAAAFTVGSGQNRLLVVAVHYHATLANIDGVDITGVTYGGVAMTRLVLSEDSVGQGMAIFYLVAPASGSANVVVSYTGTPDRLAWGAAAWSGVDPSTPIHLDSTARSPGSGFETSDPIPGVTFGGVYSYGFAALSTQYGTGFEGPPDTPSPLSSNAWTGSLVNGGGASSAGLNARMDYGSYSGGITETWAAHDGGGYRYLATSVDLIPAPELMTQSPPFFCSAPDSRWPLDSIEDVW